MQVPTKELHVIFQTIVEKVLSTKTSPTPCAGVWSPVRRQGLGGLHYAQDTASQVRASPGSRYYQMFPREYSSLASFLGTSGPLLTAAHRLLAEPYLRSGPSFYLPDLAALVLVP